MKGIAALLFSVLLLLPLPALAQNIILILADDLGNDIMSAGTYNEEVGNQDPVTKMPTLDTMAANGVLFRHAYAQPVCSPTRAALMTGHLPGDYYNQIGLVVQSGANQTAILDTQWENLVTLLNAEGYRTELYGKWHLAWGPEFDISKHKDDGIISRTESHPNDFGFDSVEHTVSGPLASDYTDWDKWTDGVYSQEATYNTSYLVTQAVAALAGSEPFFIYLPFHAPHSPFHEAPCTLLDPDDCSYYSGGGWTTPEKYASMVEAMDTEIGRLFASVDFSDTTVIFMGDNGTPNEACVGYTQSCKSSLYEGGINVPLIVRGEAVAVGAKGQVSNALVQHTDVFATILDIAGAEQPLRTQKQAISVKSHLTDPGAASPRSIVIISSATPNGGPFWPNTATLNFGGVARNLRYKYNWNNDELFDLTDDPYEQSPLDLESLTSDQQAAYDSLSAELLDNVPERKCGATDNDERRLQ